MHCETKIKAIFFDAGLTLINIFPKGKSNMFRYFCSLAFSEKEMLKLNLKKGSEIAELHFQQSEKDYEYKNAEHFWFDNYVKGLVASGLEENDACEWACVINERVNNLPKEYHLIDGVLKTLETLKYRGYKLAIVSNWYDQSLKGIINELGIDKYFDYIADSSVEGFEKPNPNIFKIVMKNLNVKPDEVVHIGDLYYSDVVGAKKAGIDAVLIDELDVLGEEFKCKRVKEIIEILDIFK